MILSAGEVQIRAGNVERESDGRDLTLYLTNQRVVVEAPERRGLIASAIRGPKTIALLDVWLYEVTNAEAVRRLIGRPLLHVQTQRGHFSAKTAEAETWVQAIVQARSRAPGPGSYHPQAAGQVIVNVNQPPPPPPPPTQTIERQVVKVRCRHCGRLGDEVLGKCQSCGAPL